jgi:hypothetical protein
MNKINQNLKGKKIKNKLLIIIGSCCAQPQHASTMNDVSPKRKGDTFCIVHITIVGHT